MRQETALEWNSSPLEKYIYLQFIILLWYVQVILEPTCFLVLLSFSLFHLVCISCASAQYYDDDDDDDALPPLCTGLYKERAAPLNTQIFTAVISMQRAVRIWKRCMISSI